MKPETASTGSVQPVALFADLRQIRTLLTGLFILGTVYALYFSRDFILPVILAFLLALMLTPIVRFLRRRGIPEPLSATLLVLISVTLIFGAGYFLSGPVIDLANNASSIGYRLTERLAELRHPFDRLMQISAEVQRATESTQEPGVQRVVMAQPGILSQAASNVLSAGTTAAITFVLSLFLMASGSMFYEKIVQSFARMSEKKRALRIVYDVEREISHYLLTVALINGGLGLAIGLGLWAIGMPNPAVWGVAAALLNFLPYIGAALTIILVAIISLITFPSIAFAMIAPAYVLTCNIIEGQFVTPVVVGRRLEINAVSIFIAVAFWSWLWGIIGALIAVPLLVVIKVFCDHFDSLRHIGNFLAAQQSHDSEEAAEEAK
ncbi:AI-2E family transporter [Corticibacterium sp. UT-5YL-CI-8]|nr:AI-2E family transporter [Tianweitania sp. UT-5YL-CI-8]